MARHDLAALVATTDLDEALKREIHELAVEALRQARYYLKHGTPANKMQVLRTLMPVLSRSFAEQQTDDEMEEMRRELGKLRQELGA